LLVRGLLAFALLLVFAQAMRWMLTTPEERAFRARFRLVQQGMTGDAVVELLGVPADRGPVFHLGQELGFEAEHERARVSGAVLWLFWHKELDLTFAVGLDKSGCVCMTSQGGT
jgi:hypothetical protein